MVVDFDRIAELYTLLQGRPVSLPSKPVDPELAAEMYEAIDAARVSHNTIVARIEAEALAPGGHRYEAERRAEEALAAKRRARTCPTCGMYVPEYVTRPA